MSINISTMPTTSWDYNPGVVEIESMKLIGHLSIPEYIGEAYETYTGSYEITPNTEFQLLPTADRVLTDDILVHPIPYSEVSNEQGGITVTIGE